MASSAGGREVDLGDGAGRVGSAHQIVRAVAIGADGGRTTLGVGLAVNRSGVTWETDGEPHKVGSDNRGVAVALTAGLGDTISIDEAGGVRDSLDMVAGVAVGASGGSAIAVESRHAVDTGAVGSFNLGVASSTAESFFLARVGDLVGAVTGEAVHLALIHQRLVDSADELIAVTGVAFVAGGNNSLIEMRLVRGVDVVTGGAAHDATSSNDFAVSASFDLLHSTGMAAFTEFIDCAGGRGKSGGVSSVAARATGGRLASFGGDGVDGRVVAPGLAIMAAFTGVLGRSEVERFDLVRIASDGMASGAVGSFSGTGCQGFAVETADERLTGGVVA